MDGVLKERWYIAAVLLVEAALLPWTAHAYDVTAFLSHAERVYFAHVPPAALWPFGSISLAALLLSQLPVLFFPSLWSALPLRIALLKLPAFVADVASAAIVRSSATIRADADAWALRYLVDPAVVFVTVFHGQNDALPNAFAVGGIAATVVGRYELAGLALGLGAGAKFYPAAFVPLLVVVAFRNASLARALRAAGAFAGAAALTLLPVLWGRAGSVFAAYRNNSFGAPGGGVSTASLWTLVPHHLTFPALPAIEQSVAVAIPVILAAAELRHAPNRRDVARAAMLSALAVVLLNPGAHPPFYLWIAGPLVLYAAVAGDGIVSLAGLALSLVGTLTQFCQEGSDEYFILNFGFVPREHGLQCAAPAPVLAALALCVALAIVAASYRRELFAQRLAQACGRTARVAAALCFIAFAGTIAVETASAASLRKPGGAYAEEERAVNTFAVAPAVARGAGQCSLTYSAEDVVVFADNAYASRFATASLGYTLYSPETVTIRGRTLPAAELPSRFENVDLRAIDQHTARVTREFDVSALLRPYHPVERIGERPCSFIAENPLLIYRFDVAAARAAAAERPLFERLDIVSTRSSAPEIPKQ